MEAKVISEKAADASPAPTAPNVAIIAKDVFALHPKPVPGDSLDPLNWSSFQKHVILAIVMALYFLFTYITTTTVPTFAALQETFDPPLTIEMVNWTVAIPALGLALGPLIWSSPADILGRRFIFILGTAIALASTIGAGVATTYGGYMAARLFQGLGVSPAATVGLAIINDLFFEHERGEKVGLWVLAIDTGLLVGPLIGGFIQVVDYKWVQWLTAILFGIVLVAELLFMPETLYPRDFMLAATARAASAPAASSTETTDGTVDEKKGVLSEPSEKPSAASEAGQPVPELPAEVAAIKRTKTLPYVNVLPVPALKYPKPWDSVIRFLKTFKFVVLPISIGVFCFGWYWWVLSVLTMLPVAYADYSPQTQGLFSLGLIIGTLVAEVAFSGRLSDWIVVKLAKRNNGLKVAEMRLWLAYPATILTAVGLILWGVSIDKGYHWMVGQVAFALFGAGIQMGNAAIATYAVDCYPLQSMAIVTFYSVFLNMSAFVNPFFIAPWVDTAGYTWTFAGQAIITVFFCVPILALIHKFGPKIRAANGVPDWVNPEYDNNHV